MTKVEEAVLTALAVLAGTVVLKAAIYPFLQSDNPGG